MYLVGYGVWRFVIEFFRSDDRGAVGALSTSQFIGIFIVLAGVVLLLLLRAGKTACVADLMAAASADAQKPDADDMVADTAAVSAANDAGKDAAADEKDKDAAAHEQNTDSSDQSAGADAERRSETDVSRETSEPDESPAEPAPDTAPKEQ